MLKMQINRTKPVQNNFLGVSAVYHGFAGMPDDAGRVYSEELCELEADRIKSLGVKVVRTYYKWWAWSRKRFGDSRRGLWIRNNGSTMISQFLNTVLYTFFAFYGTYSFQTLVSIFLSSYTIYFFTSLLDTPFVYWCRKIHEKNERNS